MLASQVRSGNPVIGIGQTATRLYIAETTAKTHVAHIYGKLGAGNRAQAVMAAVRMGLIRGLDDR
jgi:DNA-binding NarL/FixJ family response regulator